MNAFSTLTKTSASRRRHFLGALVVACSTFLGAGVAQAQETIKLGFIGPMSGGNAQQGLGAKNGFLLAIDQWNNTEGVPFKVEGVVLDDASDPQAGVSAALKLVNDRDVVAATGHWNSPVALATLPVFNRSQMPFIVWGAISPKITEQNLANTTRVTPTLVNENKPLADWAAKDLGAKKIAIIADTSDYGAANLKWFGTFFEEAGGEVIARESFPVGTTDFRAILTKVKSLSPDAVYFGGVITEAGIVRKQMAELGMEQPMLGISGIHDPELIEIAGEAANGVVVGVPKAQSNPKLKAMEDAYKAKGYKEAQSPYTKYAYDATGILLEAIKQAGPKDKKAIAETIRGISYDGALGTTTFDDNGQTEIPVDIEVRTVKNGEWASY
ncbi:MAG: branched chain amino acid ABC transporter substrate-binding protein [Pusillimonas sp.]|nr:branched chain amino acid ABC transporter substrate-binding protein [Pusillimonas sp.]MBC41404.1 branched chain amino acid ABC transporter substrate-binding protein [Pusillimonas sp.]HCP79961.1 branched-chain amino acid ABC transporter substrate-binding protein [Pusillimonas sp.]|tara:strand:+ start:41448 stop:42599 length:1152 start_codon:yes stop_codon:yes gene_type:complete